MKHIFCMETPVGQTLINATSQVLATDTHRLFFNFGAMISYLGTKSTSMLEDISFQINKEH